MNLDVQNSKITFSAIDERQDFPHTFHLRPSIKSHWSTKKTRKHTHTHTHYLQQKNPLTMSYIQSLDAVNVHSWSIGCSIVEFRWLLSPSSIPFGHAARLMVVSCSLIGTPALASFPRMDMCMVLRCRRESYLLELISEKLWPRRELRSDERRCRLRIRLGMQQSRYLQRSLTQFNDHRSINWL